MMKGKIITATTLSVFCLNGTAIADLAQDSHLDLKLRNFYFNNDNRNGKQSPSKTEEWGQGFIFDFKSGYTDTPIQVGLDVLAMSAFRLDSGSKNTKVNRSRNPGTIFPLKHNGRAVNSFGTVGVTAKFKYSKTELHYGTLQPFLPVITYNDGRLLPQTFKGVMLTSNEIDKLTLNAGQISQAKGRNASGYSNLSVLGANSPRRAMGKVTAAPARESNKFLFGGMAYQIRPDLKLYYQFGQLKNFYNQHFLGMQHQWHFNNESSLETDLRYFDSRSQGKNSRQTGRNQGYTMKGYYNNHNATGTTLGKVDNKLFSGTITYKYKDFYIGAGYQQLSGKSDFPWLDQGNGTTRYTFSSVIVANYTRSGERTRMLRAGYNFAELGLPGLKLDTMYLTGDKVNWAQKGHKEWERDTVLSYTFGEGPLKNVSVKWLNALYRTSLAGLRDQDENRLIIDYILPIF